MLTDDKLSAEREAALKALCVGTWRGTADMVRELVVESQKQQGWKPVRAAVAHGVDANSDRVWMRFEEFATWVQVAKATAIRARLGTGHPRTDLGFQRNRFTDLQRRDRAEAKGIRVRKTEALACAHYVMGWPKPVETGDAEGFFQWFEPRFSTQTRIAAFLDVEERFLRDRLRGWTIVEGQRRERAVEGFVIRALDWVWRMGPTCPYGDRSPAEVYPGQIGATS